MRPEAVLFDLDGTLLDSETLWEAAQAETMAYFGQTWTAQDQAYSIGGPIERVVAHMAQRTGAEADHVVRVLVTEIEHRVATQAAHWLPGAREFLLAVRAAGIPTAIVSNSWRVLLDLLVANLDVPVDMTVSSTEVDRAKPDPQPYLLACRALDASPEATVVVEDSPTGVRSGLAAGCTVIGVGPVVAGVDADRYHHVASLREVALDASGAVSFGGDRVQDP
jgi:HAD superfamily hydrolase (TIGR01509 family)